MSERHGNWIDGQWCRPRRGFTFSVESPLLDAPRERLEWPRSGSEEVESALKSADAARAAWIACDRGPYLKRLCRDLETNQDLDLAQLLDLEDEDLTAHTVRLTSLLESGDLAERSLAFLDSELLLARPDWRQLFLGFETTLSALLAGCPVLLLSDASVPQLARALARAAESAGLPRGLLTVLHDDGWTTFRAALSCEQVTDVFLAGDQGRLTESEQLVARHQRVPAVSLGVFGAGLDSEEAGGEGLPRLQTHGIHSRSTVVRAAESLEAAVGRVLEESLGRFSALDGLLDGRAGLVLCPERRFAAFTTELLFQLEELVLPLEGPLSLDEGLSGELAQACERGLDEGATLIQGGPAGSRGAGGSLPDSRGAILVPTIFTNVEEHMQLVRSSRPAPLLCLMRVASEGAGDKLAARLAAPNGV